MFRRCLLALFFLPVLAAGQADPTSRSWNQPVEPFRIAGNLYYVGASDIASYLIATPKGHILLDGGFVETVPLIRESVKKLGFKIEDVKILLNTHAHYDHAGGLAELKKLTGARLHASEADAPALARGGKDDPLFGDQFLFPPVQADRLVKDGDTVTLGGSTLTARLTPGHTAGCTTWTMKVDGLNVVFVCSTSVLPMMKLGAEPSYPGIADDYARTFRVLRAIPCDLFLAAHGSFYNLKEKAERLKKGEGENPFVDPDGYRSYLDRNEKVFRERLEKDRNVSAPPKNP
ncbi:MAG TPA: subclass B3 metallo-beta-lactamase [Thermoanaerobaculia bacterium]|jgi:metallo-beta-lactamase class B|nr:subclass B3 metallo-beta-lactamase [Thermoanaerobaculia bacterium]